MEKAKETPTYEVLVVEDEAAFAELLVNVLSTSEQSLQLIKLDSGEQAIEHVKSASPDVILLDIRLPGMTGLEALKAIKDLNDEVVVVMMTAHATLESAVEALRCGAYDYIIKPFKAEDVKSVVNQALERRKSLRDRARLVDDLTETNKTLRDDRERLVQNEKELDRQLDRKLRQLSALSELTTRLSDELELGKLLHLLLEEVARTLEVKDRAVMLFHDKDRALVVKLVQGFEGKLERGMRLEMSDNPLANVVRTGDPLLLSGDEAGSSDSMACVCLRGRTERFGLLCAGNRVDGAPLGEKDLELLSTIGGAASIALQNISLFEDLRKSYLETLLALVLAAEAKDPYLRGHSERVAKCATWIAREMGLPREEVRNIQYAAILHDIGKIGLRDELLTKDGELSPQEFALIQKHQVVGERIIRPIRFLEQVRPLIRHHHERYNGEGHPDHLVGEDIPLGARILKVADAYDALTSHRAYRRSMSSEETSAKLRAEAGKQFDPNVVEVLLRMVEKEKEKRKSPSKGSSREEEFQVEEVPSPAKVSV
jgi:putative nucleotidyltransferase with HDIG domain